MTFEELQKCLKVLGVTMDFNFQYLDARRIPIIAMTANAFAEDVQASLDAGMNGHLAKPIVMDEVVKAIASNLRS